MQRKPIKIIMLLCLAFLWSCRPQKDFVVNINPTIATFVNEKETNLGTPPNGSGSWLFVDEITVE